MNQDVLDTLLAKQAITEQLHHYCRAMDRIDNELGKAVWHADGTADFGELYRGTGAGWIEHVSRVHAASCLSHSHMVGNILIKVSGHTAVSETYVHAILLSDVDGKRLERNIRGRYLDRWSLRDGRWAIDHRKLLIDLSSSSEALGEGLLSQPWGCRDRRDPSYDYL
jgi:hypothetical protein